MTFTVGIIGAGAMGSAIGARLTGHGAKVLTPLDGRSGATRSRAQAAGMKEAEEDLIVAEATVILSVVPPAEALAVARRFAARLGSGKSSAVYVDCNAVSVARIVEMGRVFADAGVRFVDGGIIGGPPKKDDAGPRIYVSGDLAGEPSDQLTMLKEHGLDIRRLEGAVGVATSLKLSYAGITKGLTALGACMILAAERAGSGSDLKKELAASQPQLLAHFSKAVPDMYSKAYRWVDEMESISEFIGNAYPESEIYTAAAHLYERIAADFEKDAQECALMDSFLRR